MYFAQMMKPHPSNTKHIRKFCLYVYQHVTKLVTCLLLLFLQKAHSQIVLTGDVVLYNANTENSTSPVKSSSETTFYISENVQVTNLQKLIEDNPTVKFVVEDNLASKPDFVEQKNRVKEHKKEVLAKRNSNKYVHPIKIQFRFQTQDSDEHLSVLRRQYSSQSTVPNFNSQIKFAIIHKDIISKDYSKKLIFPIFHFLQDKYGFNYLLCHLIRPPPSFS